MKQHEPTSRWQRCRRIAGLVCVCGVLLLLTAWGAAALFFDVRIAWLRFPVIAAYLVSNGAALVFLGSFRRRALSVFACFAVVFCWWLTLRPSNEGAWQTDVSKMAWAEVDGDRVTLHNLRLCSYQTESQYTCEWQTRLVDLKELRGVDLFLDYWGSPWIAHTILSFDFGAGNRVAFSIEARKRMGQSYSAIGGFFRQFTLISLISDERDVVRLRTNYRTGEDLYLYHTTATIPFARSLFLDYVGLTNYLHDHPKWYNAVTHNCTTQIFALKSMRSQPWWHWEILLNGKGDAMEYRLGNLAADKLPFDELRRRAYINPAAKAAGLSDDFSEKIRARRPGFSPSK
jgi:hypothetical protein